MAGKNRIITRVTEDFFSGWLGGSYTATAIDLKTGKRAVRSAYSAEEAEFLAIDELTRTWGFDDDE